MSKKSILIIGGGAAGYFTALNLASAFNICILEAGRKPLQKVLVSGGGRCNVTHSCFDEARLVTHYPRGMKELRAAFSRFQPADMTKWLEKNGVQLKTEDDGRIFPVSDSSKTIIDCFEKLRLEKNIKLETETKVTFVKKLNSGEFLVKFKKQSELNSLKFDFVVIATGSSKSGYKIAESLGHKLENPVPSLFSFNILFDELKKLAGISVSSSKLTLKITGEKGLSKTFKEEGPCLITHWGLSGPAVIKLSAWAAKEFYLNTYKAELFVNWNSELSKSEFTEFTEDNKINHPKKKIVNLPLADFPKRLWTFICNEAGISDELSFGEISKKLTKRLEEQIFNSKFEINGKGVFKEEFVTCGGVKLSEIEFSKMESKIVPGLFFAGEVLDIDGLTGGFNFQSAWTGAYIISQSIK